MAFDDKAKIGSIAIGVNDMVAGGMLDDNELEVEVETKAPINYDFLENYILTEFGKNQRARTDSGIEDRILDSLRAYNGEYTAKDKALIERTGGSTIFMNVTATKARAAKSWIADVMLPSVGNAWELKPSPLSDLPEDIQEMIRAELEKEFEEMSKPEIAPETPQGPGAVEGASQGQPQTPPGRPQASRMEAAQELIRDTNQRRRDIERAISGEITAEAKFQLERMSLKIDDQFKEGNWTGALLEFLDDFVIYPIAIMKGPVVTKKKGLVWKDGNAVEIEKYCFLNQRVDPLDLYPSPNAKCIEDGNLMEHLRFSPTDIERMRGTKNYIDENIEKVLEDAEGGIKGSWVDTGIEQENQEEQGRGTIQAYDDTIHGLHFWGSITLKKLREWDYADRVEGIPVGAGENDVLDVEAILVGNYVIKMVINDDPLKRRPYYTASFMNVPGAFYGKSLPELMDSQQRMCNATCRALSNNLGISSGPQVELYTDRLADAGDITDITPFKIWQLKSDPTGGSGRAINFFSPDSHAQELLEVYNQFESKADDVTGIPKYAYGNEKTAGATQTAQGLAMLLESTSKIIKDCIRNIDEGLVKKRVTYQFHYNMNLPDFNYTGDINVITVGSATLSVRGVEATRRNEFLQATANPEDMGVMGKAGRATILRKMADDLGLPMEIVPTNYEVKQIEKKDKADAQEAQLAMAQAEQAKADKSIQATTVQVEGQKQMHEATMQKELIKIQQDQKKHDEEMQLKIATLQTKLQEAQEKMRLLQQAEENKSNRQTQEVALKLKTGKPGI